MPVALVACASGGDAAATVGLPVDGSTSGTGASTQGLSTSTSNPGTTRGSSADDPRSSRGEGRDTTTTDDNDDAGRDDDQGTGGGTTGEAGSTGPALGEGSSGAALGSSGGVECGNGVREGDEACDGEDLGEGCAALDASFNLGTPTCNADCELEAGSCEQLDDPFEVCQQLDLPPRIPLAIPDAGGGSVSATITLDEPGVIENLEVRVVVEHTYINDLGIDIIKGGDFATLWNRECDSEDNLDIYFSDGAEAVQCGLAFAGQTFAPSESLSALSGATVAGEYELVLQDFFSGDTGQLLEWCLRVDWSL